MKTKTMFTPALNARFVCAGTRRLRCGSSLFTLLAAGAMLLGPGGVFRAAADFDTGFPPNVEGPIQTMGVFQVLVDPACIPLMEDNVPGHLPYPGWNHSQGTLTSPALADFPGIPSGNLGTMIARSATHHRNDPNPPLWPVVVDPAWGPAPGEKIIGYGAYFWPDPARGWDFQNQLIDARREVLTEINQFNLSVFSLCYSNNDPRIPSNIDPGTVMVRAGYANNTYVTPTGTEPNYLRKSIGMVQSQSNSGLPANDFPANSFFDINVEITLPHMAGTPGVNFPLYGAVLTNADFEVMPGTFIPDPLIVTTMDMLGPSLPPTVVYTHTPSSATSDQPWGVPLRFKYGNAGYWTAGQLFGYVVLAGHGTIPPCSKSDAVSNFLNQVLGPPGQLAQPMIVGALFPNTLFPNPGSTYGSAKGTNFGGGSIDTVYFTNGPTVLTARNFTLANLINPITLPTAGHSVVYSNSSAVLTFEISPNATTFYTAQATGTVQMLIINTNPGTIYTTTYYSEVTNLSLVGSSVLGTFVLRESPTKASPGRHIVQTAPVGYRIGGDFNMTFEYSFNNGISYKPANRPIWLQQQPNVDCGSAPSMLNVSVANSIVTITWNSVNYRLQSCTSLTPPITWVDLAVVSPYVFSLSSSNSFFRLTCP